MKAKNKPVNNFVSKNIKKSGKNVSKFLIKQSKQVLNQVGQIAKQDDDENANLNEHLIDNTLGRAKKATTSLTKKTVRKVINTSRFAKKVKNKSSRFSDFSESKIKNHAFQKNRIKKYYARSKMNNIINAIKPINATIKDAIKMGIKKLFDVATVVIKVKGKAIVLVGGLCIVVIYFVSQTSAVSDLTGGVISAVVGTSYTADDAEIKGVNDDYKLLEEAIANRINQLRTEFPDYDEYITENVETSHDPYALAAYLTVLKENYKREDVKDLIKEIFDKQYKLSTNEEVQKKTRTVTKTGKRTVTNPANNQTYEEEYTYEEQEEYDYKILRAKIEQVNFESIVDNTLTESQKKRYQAILNNKGNRAWLFADETYAQNSEGIDYTIPGEALSDVKFANMTNEAKKHVGTPYVWGGKSPGGFDCSGFVSYVINYSGNGWNVGTADTQGLLNSCNVIPASSAKAGDLIFFKGTYNSGKKWGVSHVGIYLGNGMMMHAGHPVKYSSVNTPYWTQHFLCYGRLP